MSVLLLRTPQIAGEIKDFDPGDLVDKKSARRLDLVIKYILVAGKKVALHADARRSARSGKKAQLHVGHAASCAQWFCLFDVIRRRSTEAVHLQLQLAQSMGSQGF